MIDRCNSSSVRFSSEARHTLRRASVASSLTLLLALQPVFAEAPSSKPTDSTNATQMQGQQRVLHALNRFTFGPRPGEVAEVEKIGLKRWFDLQLNPAAIDDSALDARLASYPAMQLSIADLELKYPSPAMIRGMANGRIPLPPDPTARTLAQDQVAFYKIRIANKTAEKDAPAAMPGKATSPNAAADDRARNTMESQPSSAAMPPKSAQADPYPYPHEAVQRILALPPDQRLADLLAMPPADLVSLRQALRGAAAHRLAAGMSPAERETLVALGGSNRMIATEEMDTRVLRDVYSRRQLEAVMTDFWLNHFNVYVRKNQNEPYLIPSFERTVRAHALGNFEDLLVATADSPAMLEYLDNFRSIGPDSQAAQRVELARQRNPNGPLAKNASAGLNENYGRELMELQTLGVNGGYTQADVTEVSKVFTGWTIDKPAQGGEFQFDERRHEPGTKLVLGKKIQENGEKEGFEVLHLLATSPATAHFISQQLAVRFVSDDPPPALVDRMAATFLKTHGDIQSVLRTLFGSPEFWSPTVYRAKVKTPEEFVLSAVRAGDLQIEDPGALVQSLQRLGMPLYGMQTPNGYSWTKDGWVSTGALVSRMNFALVLSGDRLPGIRTDWDRVLGEAQAPVNAIRLQPAAYTGSAGAETSAQKEICLEQVLLHEPVSDRTRATVLAQANDASMTDQAATQFDLRGEKAKQQFDRANAINLQTSNLNQPPQDHAAAVMAGLLLGSPEFQRR